jgi:carboxylate-amine ligase
MLHLFEAVGIELEYMIVDRQSLKVKPVCDELLKAVAGTQASDWENGAIAWSNELVMHVVEFKTNGPAKSWQGLGDAFHENVLLANNKLQAIDCQLLPTAAHPLMNPFTDTVIWPYDSHEVYELYDRIFGCKGHGWSNLQSMHINLPFGNDEEFGRLHAAIRLLMPLLPTLFASSPILDGALTNFADSRLEMYRHNQDKIPSIAGLVVPEAVFSKRDYEKYIFGPITRDILPYDTNLVMDKYFLNSRGCIARFDRHAIEIRVLDIQEAPSVDLALAQFVTEILKAIVSEQWCSYENQKEIDTQWLQSIFLSAVKHGSAVVMDPAYAYLFGCSEKELNSNVLWAHLLKSVQSQLLPPVIEIIETILKEGNLSERITKALGDKVTQESIKVVYLHLGQCLASNQMFIPGNRL